VQAEIRVATAIHDGDKEHKVESMGGEVVPERQVEAQKTARIALERNDMFRKEKEKLTARIAQRDAAHGEDWLENNLRRVREELAVQLRNHNLNYTLQSMEKGTSR